MIRRVWRHDGMTEEHLRRRLDQRKRRRWEFEVESAFVYLWGIRGHARRLKEATDRKRA